MIALYVIGGLIVVITVLSIYTVKQQTFAVIERFGGFSRVTAPGLHFKIPLVETISGRVSVRVNELNVKIRTKTNDNVFVDLLIAVGSVPKVVEKRNGISYPK